MPKCPRCLKEKNNLQTLSRRDNATYICDECGQEEAMFDFEISQEKDKKRITLLKSNEAKWLNATSYAKYLKTF